MQNQKNEKIYSSNCCLSEETSVKMADGSQKRIDRMQMGDQVLGEDNSIQIVSNIFKGIEQNLIRIELENGVKIRSTPNHVFVTNENKKCAKDLKEGDLLNTLYGYCKVILIQLVEGGQVFSLELNEGHLFYAEEILNGDFTIQYQQSDNRNVY